VQITSRLALDPKLLKVSIGMKIAWVMLQALGWDYMSKECPGKCLHVALSCKLDRLYGLLVTYIEQ
jgi:hypothetical protein